MCVSDCVEIVTITKHVVQSLINMEWIVKSIKAFIVNISSRSYYLRVVGKTN